MKIATLLAALLLAVPLTAAAQSAEDIDYATRAYHAMNQINAEGLPSDNSPRAAKRALIIMRNWGLYPPSDPYAINDDFSPEIHGYCEGCIYRYNEETGQWEEYGGEWRTYECHSQKSLDDLKAFTANVHWAKVVFAWSAGIAGITGNPIIAGGFGFQVLVFDMWEYNLNERYEAMWMNRCGGGGGQ